MARRKRKLPEATILPSRGGIRFPTTGLVVPKKIRDAFWRKELMEELFLLRQIVAEQNAVTRLASLETALLRGKPGAPGYPREVREYALQLRLENPRMPAPVIRGKCLTHFRGRFDERDMPDPENFARWLRWLRQKK
jgi:hypothetical protein